MDNDTKRKVMDVIEGLVDIYKPVDSIRHVIRCPICGDSQKDDRDAHCYIKHSPDPTEPIQFMCFLCNKGGVVNSRFLEKLGASKKDIEILGGRLYNKIKRAKTTNVELLTGAPIMTSPQVAYVTHRLGPGFTYDDYDKFKIVWDINSLIPYVSSNRIRNILPSNHESISFLSEDKSMVIVRQFSDTGEDRWAKTKLFPFENRSLYTIKSTLDLFTQDTIEVNIAEGIFDVLSIYKNFSQRDNAVHIAVLGSSYTAGVDYAISHGIIGCNVKLNVYMDDNIKLGGLKHSLKKYKWMFKSISIYRNRIGKDVGVPMDQIKLIEFKV